MKKIIVAIIAVMYFCFSVTIGNCQSLGNCIIQGNDIESIYVSVTITPIKNSQYCYDFSTNSTSQIEYIIHMINAMNLTDDEKVLNGADVPTVNISITKTDGTIEKCGFISGRFYDTENKQYAVDSEEYSRFLDFIYVLKTEKLILPPIISHEPSEWAKSDMEKACSIGLLPEWNRIGYTDGVTRFEICQLVDNFLAQNGIVPEIDKSYSFEDIKDRSVENLYALGIIIGESEVEFCPYDYSTREEAAKILSGLCKATGIKIDGTHIDYADKDDISDWAINYVEDMTAMGIFTGDDDNKFNPRDNITKEELIVILLRVNDKL